MFTRAEIKRLLERYSATKQIFHNFSEGLLDYPFAKDLIVPWLKKQDLIINRLTHKYKDIVVSYDKVLDKVTVCVSPYFENVDCLLKEFNSLLIKYTKKTRNFLSRMIDKITDYDILSQMYLDSYFYTQLSIESRFSRCGSKFNKTKYWVRNIVDKGLFNDKPAKKKTISFVSKSSLNIMDRIKPRFTRSMSLSLEK